MSNAVLPALPDEEGFHRALVAAIARAQRKAVYLAILCLDFDDLIHLRENHGDANAEQVVASIIERLQKSIRLGDVLARPNATQFMILLEPIYETKDIATVSEKILSLLTPTYTVDDATFSVRTSIGISVCPNEGTEADVLIGAASKAMHQVKDKGQFSYLFFQAELHKKATARILLEQQLRAAVLDQQFQLYYQPQFSFSDKKLIGIEVLLRWDHEEKGLLAAEAFFPIAEKIGIMPYLTEWMLKTASGRINAWKAAELIAPETNLAINLSCEQLQKGFFEKTLTEFLEQHAFHAEHLTFEINDTILQDYSNILHVIHYLSNMGVNVILEQFGMDRISLLQLSELPISQLKIAPQLVQNCDTDSARKAIELGMMIAQQMGVKVIGTGIETQAQYQFLDDCGCDMGQGFYLGEPMAEDEMSTLLQKRATE